MRCTWHAIGFALLTASCLDTGLERATIPLRVAGTAATAPFSEANGWSIELTRGELAFGPLYLCSGFQAGSLCETARMEWVESAVLDVLDAEMRDIGVLRGVTGPVRSWMYDLGITSLLTQQRPLPLPAAEALGGHSVVLAGIARKQRAAIPFLFEIPVQQEQATEIGASVVRKSGSDRFERDITGAESLTLQFDARPWVRDVDFESLIENETCGVNGPSVVCAGGTELTCQAGNIAAERDCAALGMACVRDAGCSSEVRFGADSQGYRSVKNALVAGERPAFTWGDAP